MTSKNNLTAEIKTASVIGVGKLGTPLLACLAYKGYQVIGVDLNPHMVKSINEGRSPVFEPGLDQLIGKSKDRLTATHSIESAVLNSQITFIVVATPSDAHGRFSLKYVLPACEKIGTALKQKSDHHLVVLTSTVMPETLQKEIAPLLEKHSGKICGREFGLCYNPEFIALGTVIRDFLNPDFVLIGESDPESGSALEAIYRKTCDKVPLIARMNWVNAEITKLSVNTFITTKISFANTLARICERLPGADSQIVNSSLGLDTRIGGKYLKGAVGYGGPCFPRDTIAFSRMASSAGVSARLAEATHKTNLEQIFFLEDLIRSKLSPGGVVGILGLSYKPNTDVVEESQGLLLAQALIKKETPVVVYDPYAMENVRRALHGSVQFAQSEKECVQKADIVIIVTAWENFRHSLKPALFKCDDKNRIIIDCWRLLNSSEYCNVADYIALGANNHTGQ